MRKQQDYSNIHDKHFCNGLIIDCGFTRKPERGLRLHAVNVSDSGCPRLIVHVGPYEIVERKVQSQQNRKMQNIVLLWSPGSWCKQHKKHRQKILNIFVF